MFDSTGSDIRAMSRFALVYGLTAIIAVLLLSVAVHLVVKLTDDVAYIEANTDAPKWALRLAEVAARWRGQEAMSEQECPAEMLPNGRSRVWLANIA